MTSAKYDGSDVNTIISTNTRSTYYAIRVFGSVIYYAKDRQLLMINKTQGSTPTVLYDDGSRIGGIFVFNQMGMYSAIFLDLLLETDKDICYKLYLL